MILKKFLITLSLLYFTPYSYSQNYFFVEEIGKFESAKSFYFLTESKFVVSDVQTNEIILFENKVESKRIGGYGWGNETFDSPIKIFTDPLNIFVADFNNHRIQRYDKYLNFAGSMHNRNDADETRRFGFPLGVVQSSQGDLFILDSENKRILKFNSSGNFYNSFGGFDYGNFALNEPKDISIDNENRIYILDKNNIKVFDDFGTGVTIIDSVNGFKSINTSKEYLLLNSVNEIYYSLKASTPLNFQKLNLFPQPEAEISEVKILRDKLFVLTKKNIWVYERADEKQ